MKTTTTISTTAAATAATQFATAATTQTTRVDRNGDVVPVGLSLGVRSERCVSID